MNHQQYLQLAISYCEGKWRGSALPLSCHHHLIGARFFQTSFLPVLSIERHSPQGQTDEEQQTTTLGSQASPAPQRWQLGDDVSVQACENFAFQRGDELDFLLAPQVPSFSRDRLKAGGASRSLRFCRTAFVFFCLNSSWILRSSHKNEKSSLY